MKPTMPSAEAAHLRYRGLFWRALLALLVFQAAVWALAALLAYAIARPELARDYYSAHRNVRAIWDLLVPALAVSAAAGFALGALGIGVGVWRYSRRLRRPLVEIDGILREMAQGRLPVATPGAAPGQGDTAGSAAALLAPLSERVGRLGQLARDLQKVSLELNYKASGTVEITLKDLRAVAQQLDAHIKDLSEELKWFER